MIKVRANLHGKSGSGWKAQNLDYAAPHLIAPKCAAMCQCQVPVHSANGNPPEQEQFKQESVQQSKIDIITIINTLIHNIETGANGRWTSDKNSRKVTLFQDLMKELQSGQDYELKNYYHCVLDICNQHRNYLCFWEPHCVMEFKQLINEKFNLETEGIDMEKIANISDNFYL